MIFSNLYQIIVTTIALKCPTSSLQKSALRDGDSGESGNHGRIGTGGQGLRALPPKFEKLVVLRMQPHERRDEGRNKRKLQNGQKQRKGEQKRERKREEEARS
jgi:hypothetical protein